MDKSSRIRWIMHVQGMSVSREVRKIFAGNPGGRMRHGRPRFRYLDDVDDDLRNKGCEDGVVAQDRDRWKKIISEVEAIHGL